MNNGPIYEWPTNVNAHPPSQTDILMVEGQVNILMTQVSIWMTQGANIRMAQPLHYPPPSQYTHDPGSQYTYGSTNIVMARTITLPVNILMTQRTNILMVHGWENDL